MRFRKVRSFLSAYSNDELEGRQKDVVREHLAQDESLKREALIFKKIKDGTREFKDIKLSDDFNARLLNRIAKERFVETRTKAYLPARIPGLWRKIAVPAMTTLAVALFGLVGYATWQNLPAQTAAIGQVASVDQPLGDDNSYLYVSSAANPNLNRPISGRTLSTLVERVDRADRISRQIARGAQYVTNNQLAAANQSNGRMRPCPIPFSIQFFRVRPILKVQPTVPQIQGEEQTY